MRSITDFDISDPATMKELLKIWESIEIIAEDSEKVTDLKMEINDRWKRAGLSEQQAQAIRLNLVEGYIQDEVAKKLGFKSGRWISRLIEQGLEKLAGAG